MTTPSTPEDNSKGQPREASFWAQRVTTLKVGEVPPGAVNLNVDGRRVVNPLLGFGPLWQKTYQVRLPGASVGPAEVVSVWKRRFPEFQPPENRLYPAMAGVAPGQIVLLNASMRGLPVNSGLMVLYADAESFAFMTPEGCPEAGWIMCSAYDDEGETVAQVQTQGRSNDPLFEVGFRFLGGAKQQEKIWTHVLRRVAAHFDVDGRVALNKVCLDPSIRWAGATNVWRNATVRSVLYTMTAPARWARGGGGK
jgi:hypothetical protein